MDYNIMEYGAVADGTTNNSGAIQAAVDACTEAGGGRVIVPTGRFLSGTIVLKSNVTLYLEKGAELISSLRKEDILDFFGNSEFEDPSEATGWEGGCFLCALHEHDISILGEGTIYGQGDQVFYDDGADGGIGECPKNVRIEDRPRTTYFEDVENLTVRGLTFRDAAFWTLHMAGCRHVLVDGIRILNDQRGANNDGIDPDTCQDVVISNCIIKSGDDAIVVKNSVPMAKKYGCCENIVIKGCVLYSHDSALKVGTETGCGIRHVMLSDCVFRECSRGVGIWVRDGAVIEDIHVHHVSGNTKRYADCPQREFAPRWWGKGEPIFINATPRKNGGHPGIIRNITFDHISMTAESSLFIAGEEDAVIEDVIVENLNLTLKQQGTQKPGVFDEQPSQRDVYPHEIPAIYIRSAKGVEIQGNIRRDGIYKEYPLSQTEKTEDIKISVREK